MSGPTLPLLGRKRITLQEALQQDVNMLDKLKYPAQRDQFCWHLHDNLSEIKNLVARHLGIPLSDLEVCEPREWRMGTFNLCIPFRIIDHPELPRRVMIRFPQPYRIGEAYFPGNVDEKVRCEAATYIWLRENCPTIPIPRLCGMGFPGTQSFTAVENESLWNRLIWHVQRLWYGPSLSPFVGHQRDVLPDVGYVLIEQVEEGKMLLHSWDEHRDDPKRRLNLFRGLAQVLLSLAAVPLPKIGSWTIDNRGILTLTNRPLAILLQEFESHNIPTNIPRDLTYSSIERWALDLIACHDSRMRHQPNAIHEEGDGLSQLSALAALRTLLPNIVDRQAGGGPFVLNLNDLHNSNIFVDDEWNITCIIDLEFACVLPIQMVRVPHWLTNQGVDELWDETKLAAFETMYEEFVTVMEQEEAKAPPSNHAGGGSYSGILRHAWKTGRYWYSLAVCCTDVFSSAFEHHLLRRFEPGDWHPEAERGLALLWTENTMEFIAKKLEEQEQYDTELKRLFGVEEGADEAAKLVQGEEADESEKDEAEQDEAAEHAAVRDDVPQKESLEDLDSKSEPLESRLEDGDTKEK